MLRSLESASFFSKYLDDEHVFTGRVPDEQEPPETGDLSNEDEEEDGDAVEHILQTLAGIQAGGPTAVRDILIARKRLRNTHLELINIGADAPAEHPQLMGAINLYDANLVPDEAFRALVEGEEAVFREFIHRGGMLNRSRPNAVERPYYADDYESVYDQMHRDLTGQSGRPGRYQLVALHSETGEMVAWLTYRLPPAGNCSPRESREYASHVRRIFHQVKLRGMNQTDLPPFETMMEMDTINVRKGWEGAGTKIIAETLSYLEETEGEHCPRSIFFYRFSRLTLKQPIIAEGAWQFSGGENTSSAQLLTSCGFDHIGHRINKGEIVAREIANFAPQSNVVVLEPMWEYGLSRKFDTVQELAGRRLDRYYGVENHE
ncbi:MAG: hypothetical protein ABIG34_04010 [Candidatus Peregrinibacteria bacterium]